MCWVLQTGSPPALYMHSEHNYRTVMNRVITSLVMMWHEERVRGCLVYFLHRGSTSCRLPHGCQKTNFEFVEVLNTGWGSAFPEPGAAVPGCVGRMASRQRWEASPVGSAASGSEQPPLIGTSLTQTDIYLLKIVLQKTQYYSLAMFKWFPFKEHVMT